jgi:hypothetical protein
MNPNLSGSTSHRSPSNPLPLLVLVAITSFVNYKTAQGRGDHFAVARLPYRVPYPVEQSTLFLVDILPY